MTDLPDLSGFSGSTQFFRSRQIPILIYTEGIQFLANEVGAFWFIDVVASHLSTNQALHHEFFQLWRIVLNKDDDGCVVDAWRDSPSTQQQPLVSQAIPYTDFPADFECYCCYNGEGFTLMLKSEY